MLVSTKKAQRVSRPRRRNTQPKKLPSQSTQPSSLKLGPNRSVAAPVASGRVRQSNRPRISPTRNGDIRVVHREYLADIVSSDVFASTTFSVNPGLPATFPWLAVIAQRYESYNFRRLKFCYETEAPTTAAGTILLALDYDAADAAPTDKTQAMAYRSSTRSPPWSDNVLVSLGEDLHKLKTRYVRNGALATNLDVKTYDVGNLFVCRQGQANATTNIGELYVEYDVDLLTPQLGDAGVGAAVYGKFTGSVNSAPFGTVTGVLPATVASSGTTTSVSTFTFSQPWEGIVSVTLSGTGLTGITPSGTAVSAEQVETAFSTTQMTAIYTLNAISGQTFILTIADTTISAAIAWFAQSAV